MNHARLEVAIKVLKDTQIEKICVLGEEEAQEDIKAIQKVIDDLECFYEYELEN